MKSTLTRINPARFMRQRALITYLADSATGKAKVLLDGLENFLYCLAEEYQSETGREIFLDTDGDSHPDPSWINLCRIACRQAERFIKQVLTAEVIKARLPVHAKPIKVSLQFTGAVWQAEVIQSRGKRLVLGFALAEDLNEAINLAFDQAERNGYGR